MRLLVIGFYWLLLSIHVVGGAVWFRRFFPRESPWFGFIIPALVLIVVLNFIEHCIGMPTLIWLLPFSLIACISVMLDPDTKWKGLRLPTGIFLVAFAFTLFLRALKPNIFAVSSGNYDLPVIASFCMGEKVPPSFCWFPPYNLGQYYTFVHYGASVLIRLLNVDVGTGFNLSSALLSAWICFATAAIAWRVSRQRAWIAILAAVLVECAANGTTAYLCFTSPTIDPTQSAVLFNDVDDASNKSPLLKLLRPVGDYFSRRELEIPGYWSWLGTYHATNGGQFFTLFSVWSLVEVLRRRPSNWPWIGLVVTPVLMLITSAWGAPMVAVLMAAGLAVASYYRLLPQSARLVLAVLTATAVLLAPTLNDFLVSVVSLWREETWGDNHTQFYEFLLDWWPIFLPWLAALCVWPRLSPAVKIVWVLAPLSFWWVEYYTVAARVDMTGKLWGYLWGMAWCVLFPVVAMRRGWGFRILTAVLLLSNFVSFFFWMKWTLQTTPWDTDVYNLQGAGLLQSDPLQAKVMAAVAPIRGQILLAGTPSISCNNCPILANYTLNYDYIDATYFVNGFFCPGAQKQADLRCQGVIDFYAGKIADPLAFLRYRNIAAVIIWPEDHIRDAVVAKLRQQLAPSYVYRDLNPGNAPNAGVFIYHRPAK